MGIPLCMLNYVTCHAVIITVPQSPHTLRYLGTHKKETGAEQAFERRLATFIVFCAITLSSCERLCLARRGKLFVLVIIKSVGN
jgi:hypothetical protein